MAQGNNFRNDRFGNPYTVVGCKDKKGTGFAKGYVEIKGELYKLEPSDSNKDGVDSWIRVTKMPKQNQSKGF